MASVALIHCTAGFLDKVLSHADITVYHCDQGYQEEKFEELAVGLEPGISARNSSALVLFPLDSLLISLAVPPSDGILFLHVLNILSPDLPATFSI